MKNFLFLEVIHKENVEYFCTMFNSIFNIMLIKTNRDIIEGVAKILAGKKTFTKEQWSIFNTCQYIKSVDTDYEVTIVLPPAEQLEWSLLRIEYQLQTINNH